MKSLVIVLASLSLLIYSCQEGPVGPRGERGPQGEPGENGQEGFTFEYIVDFISPNYSSTLDFPNDFQMLDSDVVLVYFLWGVDNDLEIWRQLPQTLLLEEGTLLYNFDFTTNDVVVFMDADFNMDVLGANYTDEWVARVVVVPAQFADNGRIAGVDFSDYFAVKSHFNLPDIEVDEKYKSIVRP